MEDTNSRLMDYILSERFNDIKLFFNSNVNIKCLYNGHTPLMRAVKHNRKSVVLLLIESNADINFQTPQLFTALKVAIDRRSEAMVALLLNHKADPNIAGALFWAAEKNYGPIIDLLLDEKADISRRDEDTLNTPLHYSSEYNETYLQKLLLRNANPNIQNKRGKTPLFYAVYSKKYQHMRLLLEYGADPTIKDNEGWTPFHRCFQLYSKNIIFHSYIGDEQSLQVFIDYINVSFSALSHYTITNNIEFIKHLKLLCKQFKIFNDLMNVICCSLRIASKPVRLPKPLLLMMLKSYCDTQLVQYIIKHICNLTTDSNKTIYSLANSYVFQNIQSNESILLKFKHYEKKNNTCLIF